MWTIPKSRFRNLRATLRRVAAAAPRQRAALLGALKYLYLTGKKNISLSTIK